MTAYKHFQTSSGLSAAAFVLVNALLVCGCSQQSIKAAPHEMLNAVLWSQTSAEYIGNTLQVYQTAIVRLDEALAEPQWTAALEQVGVYANLPPAIMMDLDQTVLDNTAYNANMIAVDQMHSQGSHANWCRNFTAPAVPGARKFLAYAARRGVTVIYNSARTEAMRDCTTANLQQLGLPLADQSLLLLSDGNTTKSLHRATVSRQYRILLLVGDNLNDFVVGSITDPAARRALASKYADRWGREWIILPNPMYGNWESSLYEFDYTLPRDEQLQRKRQQLQH